MMSVAFLVALNAATRSGRTGFLQNMTGVLESPVKKVLSSAVNGLNSIYGHIFEYDALLPLGCLNCIIVESGIF